MLDYDTQGQRTAKLRHSIGSLMPNISSFTQGSYYWAYWKLIWVSWGIKVFEQCLLCMNSGFATN